MGVEGCETQLHALACRHLAYPTSPMKVSCWEHNGCGCIGVELISQPAHPTAVQCLYKQEGATNQNSLACAKHDSRAHEATRFNTQACRSAIDIDQAGLHWFLAGSGRGLLSLLGWANASIVPLSTPVTKVAHYEKTWLRRWPHGGAQLRKWENMNDLPERTFLKRYLKDP